MPELPEVESTVRRLRPRLAGLRIDEVLIHWRRSIDRPAAAQFKRMIAGRRIAGLTRRGKFLVFALGRAAAADECCLLVHLRMSGRLQMSGSREPRGKHTRLEFLLSDGSRLRFDDPRKFGRVYLLSDPQEMLRELGPEPLHPRFTASALAALLAPRKSAIKPLLLNQRLLAGVGNIYADEALWQARIHPLKRADRLSAQEVAALHMALKNVLKNAIKAEGTDSGDGVVIGGYRPRVYGRAGQPCRRCRSTIERLLVTQRGTHICPACQRR